MLKISGLSRRPNGVSYLYDGDGRRVKSSGGASGTRTYWYDEAGNVVGESGANNAEYFYLAGKMLARNSFGGSSPIKYYYRDHLGTTRMMTDSSGNVCYDGRVAQATMMGVPRPSRVCLGGGFSLDFINRCAKREITIWCRGRQQMEGRDRTLPPNQKMVGWGTRRWIYRSFSIRLRAVHTLKS